MSEEKVRKAMGPMTTMICTVDGDTIKTLKTFDSPPNPKQLKAALSELGEGTYTVLTGRLRTVKCAKVTVEKFDL